MLVSRLSRIGVGTVKQLLSEACIHCRAKLDLYKHLTVNTVGIRYPREVKINPGSENMMFELYPVTQVFQGTLFQKHHLFSTTASGADRVDGSKQKETISVTFVDKDGEEKHIKVPIGMSMLEAAHENGIELEGACEGSLACSTCHVIVKDVEYYNKLEDPTDEENDMLDLAFGLTETSRLGCQVIAKPELDGIRLALPAATRNFAVDGYVPKPH